MYVVSSLDDIWKQTEVSWWVIVLKQCRPEALSHPSIPLMEMLNLSVGHIKFHHQSHTC